MKLHESGGYLEGSAWEPAQRELPVLAADHPLVQRLLATRPTGALWGEPLANSPFQDEGVSLGLWGAREAGMLLPLWSRDREDQLWGLMGLARPGELIFQTFESELIALYGGMLQVSLENAGLIAHLNESSRALGSSFDRLESAYQELQDAQRALLARERQAVVGDLFHKVALRLQAPLGELRAQADGLGSKGTGGPAAVKAIQASAQRMDGLIQALLRRTSHAEGDGPGHLDLAMLLQQEVEFLRATEVVPEGAELELDLAPGPLPFFGVASDFAHTLRHMVEHAFAGPAVAKAILRVEGEGATLRLTLQDQGGALGEEALRGAFQPFARLGEAEAPQGRQPGAGLPAAAQLMAPYGGELRLENAEGGTRLSLAIPMEAAPAREGSLS
jgi:signal transduction histidine kinase